MAHCQIDGHVKKKKSKIHISLSFIVLQVLISDNPVHLNAHGL